MKYIQEKQALLQQIETITKDKLQLVERIEMTENVLERVFTPVLISKKDLVATTII